MFTLRWSLFFQLYCSFLCGSSPSFGQSNDGAKPRAQTERGGIGNSPTVSVTRLEPSETFRLFGYKMKDADLLGRLYSEISV
jgi:hypothetical protein